ncbi:hypothetical protein MSAN_00563800 [Mycena sanguinolenta]|uniref:Uncharacterized protein n=1 Tax=Mycena sanguinolenta TaxID=230812 RepID=A0A8H6ZA88_9AGAR|nr:hypothetical protein MSAN_00563800 [Mycena sanguinolenta]
MSSAALSSTAPGVPRTVPGGFNCGINQPIPDARGQTSHSSVINANPVSTVRNIDSVSADSNINPASSEVTHANADPEDVHANADPQDAHANAIPDNAGSVPGANTNEVLEIIDGGSGGFGFIQGGAGGTTTGSIINISPSFIADKASADFLQNFLAGVTPETNSAGGMGSAGGTRRVRGAVGGWGIVMGGRGGTATGTVYNFA